MAASTPTLKSESREMRRFYHKSANFTCYPGKPQRVVEGGVSTLVEPEPVIFKDMAAGQSGASDWGMHVTDDPDIVAYLEGRPDVLSEESFLEETTPLEDRYSRHKEASSRTIRQQNRLIDDQGKTIEELQRKLAARK